VPIPIRIMSRRLAMKELLHPRIVYPVI